jgi:hypothetical protein
MIHARAYKIMGRQVVEISCRHDPETGAGHLLFRSELSAVLGPGHEALGHLAEALDVAAGLARRDEITMYDDCGW